MIGDNAASRLKSLVDRIERLESEIKEMNSDKSEVYKEARGSGFDVKVLREVIKRRRMDSGELSERESLIDTYLLALGTPIATRARTSAIPHDPDTGEIIENVAPDASASRSGSGTTPPQEEAKVRDSLSDELPSAHPFEGERGASAPSHDDVSRVQDGPNLGIGATNYGNPSHQSPNEIIPAMPAFMQRSAAE